MKKRLTKDNRRNKAKDRNTKAKSEEFRCISIAPIIPFLKRRAISTYLLVGVSFFYSFNSLSSYPDCFEGNQKSKLSLAAIDPYANAKSQGLLERPSKKTAGPADHQYEERSENRKELEQKILKIVKKTPMEKMADAISGRDRAVAAFLVGIAMKESKFGIYSPKKNGRDCYNYWGYRGRENQTASGYSCFDSPEHAVKVVGDRIESLVKRGVKKPSQMTVWKCGSSCAGHSPESVSKWIADVNIHYYQLNPPDHITKK